MLDISSMSYLLFNLEWLYRNALGSIHKVKCKKKMNHQRMKNKQTLLHEMIVLIWSRGLSKQERHEKSDMISFIIQRIHQHYEVNQRKRLHSHVVRRNPP